MLAAQCVSNQNKIQQIVAIIGGYMQAEEDLIVQRRSNITVLPSQVSTQNQTKGVDTMRKNCYRRKDGRWQYSKQEHGLLYYAIANTYRELLERIKQIQPKVVRNVKKVDLKAQTFANLFDSYIQAYIEGKNISRQAKNEWKSISRMYIRPAFEKITLEHLTAEMLQKFINSINRERLQEKIFQRVVRVLKHAYVTDKIKKDLSLALEKPKRKNIQTRLPLDLDEQKALLAEVKNTDLYAFTMFCLIVGARREEVLSFSMSRDLNEARQIIHIRGTKTANADRYVHVSKAFIEFLKENMGADTFNFQKEYVTKRIGKILHSINPSLCLHCLRHTCSANLYFLGANDKYRQMQLGHASIVTTNDIYTNIKESIPKEQLREVYGDLYLFFD